MDLSEVPHDQWDYAVEQLVMLNSVEEGLKYNSINEDELLEVEPLQFLLPRQTDGYDMDVANESIMPLTLGYCPEFFDSTGLQEFGIPGIPSTCGLDSTSWGIPQRERNFGDNILRTTTANLDYGTLVVSQIEDSPPTVSLDPYPESLNEWLKSFTPAGVGMSSEIPEPVCGQNDMSLWASPSHECSSDLHLALMNGHYAGEMEPKLSRTKEEEESMPWSRKKKVNHQSRIREKRGVQRRRKRASQTREETEMVQRRGKSLSRSENGELHEERVRRSERVRRAPCRYIDECCKPKKKGKNKARTVMTASKGFGSGASSSFPGSSTAGNQGHGGEASKSTSFMSTNPLEGNLLLAGTQESIAPWRDPKNLLLNTGHWWLGPEVGKPYMHV